MSLKKIRVSFLPIAGIQNPYQALMMNGLKENRILDISYGLDNKIWGMLKTVLLQRPDFLHLDWETKYYYRKNLILTLFSVPLFFVQIFIIKHLLKCKIVWTPHNIIPHDAKYIRLHQICRRYLAKNSLWIRLFSSESVIVFSKELMVPETRFRIVPEGSFIHVYENKIEREEARKILNVDPSKKVLLYFGMIRRYKGVKELIEIFDDLKLENTLLLVVGNARDKNYVTDINLKASNNKDIKIVSEFIPNDAVQIYFNAADVVVLPFSKIENSGTVILSMGFKKPIVAPNMGTVKWRLQYQNDLLYTKNIREVLVEIGNYTAVELERMGNANYEFVRQFSWNDYQRCFN